VGNHLPQRDAADYTVTSSYLKQNGLVGLVTLEENFSGKASLGASPLDCSKEEIKEELNKSNPKLRVSEASRLKRGAQKDGHIEFVNTHNVSIGVHNRNLLKSVYGE
jgi:hypothetical protein